MLEEALAVLLQPHLLLVELAAEELEEQVEVMVSTEFLI